MVFTDKTEIQILGRPLRLDYHHTDVALRRATAQFLGAMRKAQNTLQEYYTETISVFRSAVDRKRVLKIGVDFDDPRFPCYRTYTDIVTREKCRLVYSNKHTQGSLVFFAKSDGAPVCVKFVTSYCQAAHEFCASRGFAPTLRGIEMVGHRWIMVVMDRVDAREYEEFLPQIHGTSELYDVICTKFRSLHQAGFVHGDVRAANILVKRDGESFMLLDFDWSGIIGEVTYPMNVNRALWRPDDARDELIIKSEHDMAGLEQMFSINNAFNH
jgi:hypothetical protein